MEKTTEELIAEDNDSGIAEEILPCEPDHIEPYDEAVQVDDQ